MRRNPERLALVDGNERLSWSELDARVASLVAIALEHGIGKGDVAGICARNGGAFVAAHLALARIGAVALLLHPAYSEIEIGELARRTSARAIFYGEYLQRLGAPGRSGAAEPPAPADPFVLAPTSGTESPQPKICMHAHEGLLANAMQVVRDAGLSERDVLLPASGFTHLFGLLALHTALLSGATIVALPKFDPERCLELYERESVTHAWAVPAQFSDVARVAEARAPRLPALREVRSAGAAMPGALGSRLEKVLGRAPLEHWGMSEIGAGIVDGIPLRGADARIVDGELQYRRADMFRGYYGQPQATSAAMTPDGFLRTGDVAALDERGRIVLRGRIKELINRGGMKVSALELESSLAGLRGMRQLAVVPVDDDRLGERAALVCTLEAEASLTLDEVRAHLAERGLAKYKWPELLIVVDELPQTPTGKIARHAVRELATRAAIA